MSVRTSAYLQIEPRWNYNHERVTGAKVVRCTQRPPLENQAGGTVLVKITLELAEAAFKPLQPEALVVVPEHLTSATPIIVEAAEPT